MSNEEHCAVIVATKFMCSNSQRTKEKPRLSETANITDCIWVCRLLVVLHWTFISAYLELICRNALCLANSYLIMLLDATRVKYFL